jgi:catechol 2,3-dioxygenase-like lactoylglutathione lyase family enzyme
VTKEMQMLDADQAFSGFGVTDLAGAEEFYGGKLGFDLEPFGSGLRLKVGGGTGVFLYPRPDHDPASFTVLNFGVEEIDPAVDELIAKGIVFEQYDSVNPPTDERGVSYGKAAETGPNIAWFKDPSGNLLSLLQD